MNSFREGITIENWKDFSSCHMQKLLFSAYDQVVKNSLPSRTWNLEWRVVSLKQKGKKKKKKKEVTLHDSSFMWPACSLDIETFEFP